MSLRKTLATASRILRQIRRDHRTVGLIFIVPCLLLVLLRYVFDGQQNLFNFIGPQLLGIFPLLMMFLITSIATLRERRSGTLDRLMTMPVSKAEFMMGYAIAFSLIALVQALLASAVLLGLLDIDVAGGTIPVVVAAVAAGFLGTSLGLFVSAFAKTEFQAVQLVMPTMAPQILVSGLFIPRDQMVGWLEKLSDVLPLTYSVDAMREVSLQSALTSTYTRDIFVIVLVGLVALVLGSVTIRRQES